MIDAHFVQGTHQIHWYVAATKANIVKRVATPTQVAQALGWNGGIHRSSVMLVSVDRDYHKLIKNKLSKVTEMAKTYFARMNEIEIFPIKSERRGGIDMCDLKNWDIKFRIKCWPYSKMGPGVEFECDLNNNHFVDLIDNEPAIPIPRRKTSSKKLTMKTTRMMMTMMMMMMMFYSTKMNF